MDIILSFLKIFGAVWAIIIAMFIIFMIQLRLLIPKITDEQLLEIVGFDWKRGRQISEELNEKYAPGRDFFGTFDTGWLYPRLRRLERDGFLESRTIQLNPKEAKFRGNNRRWEYRRTGKRIVDPLAEPILAISV